MKIAPVVLCVIILFVSLQTACGCHPQCRWMCDDPVCDAICEPLCEAPSCNASIHFQANDSIVQLPQNALQCEIRCSSIDNQCPSDSCPYCAIHCSFVNGSCPAGGICHGSCFVPRCEWQCMKPTNCTKPRCELSCERPACESSYINTPATPDSSEEPITTDVPIEETTTTITPTTTSLNEIITVFFNGSSFDIFAPKVTLEDENHGRKTRDAAWMIPVGVVVFILIFGVCFIGITSSTSSRRSMY